MISRVWCSWRASSNPAPRRPRSSRLRSRVRFSFLYRACLRKLSLLKLSLLNFSLTRFRAQTFPTGLVRASCPPPLRHFHSSSHFILPQLTFSSDNFHFLHFLHFCASHSYYSGSNFWLWFSHVPIWERTFLMPIWKITKAFMRVLDWYLERDSVTNVKLDQPTMASAWPVNNFSKISKETKFCMHFTVWVHFDFQTLTRLHFCKSDLNQTMTIFSKSLTEILESKTQRLCE